MIVQPEYLMTAATTVDASRTDLKSEHDATQAAMESALDGWVGASATSLRARLTSWQHDAGAVHQAMADHGAGLAASARLFSEVDAGNARSLTR